jgi:urate oxidase
MAGVRVRAREVSFRPAGASGTLYRRAGEEGALAEAAAHRGAGVREQRSGLLGVELVKLEGNGFAGFVRDEYTTLPETTDRPLYVRLDAWWRYARPDEARGDERYVPAEQVGDLVASVFDGLDSRSIQHLLHAMATRLLERFAQLGEVRLEAQNRTWETVREKGRAKVHTDPRPTYGRIGLTLRR